MTLRRIKAKSNAGDSPLEMFRDIKNRRIKGALDYQAHIWTKYCEEKFLGASDIAIQLPTGSGKTLVGIAIAEWRRRKFEERVVYLCPTNQLVNQVAEQSLSKCGIRVNSFTGSRSKYSPGNKTEYINSEAVAVTTYSALFNTNSFFDNADIILLDDAHSAENYISSFWSLIIDKFEDDALFTILLTVLREIIPTSQYSRLTSKTDSFQNNQWVEKNPNS